MSVDPIKNNGDSYKVSSSQNENKNFSNADQNLRYAALSRSASKSFDRLLEYARQAEEWASKKSDEVEGPDEITVDPKNDEIASQISKDLFAYDQVLRDYNYLKDRISQLEEKVEQMKSFPYSKEEGNIIDKLNKEIKKLKKDLPDLETKLETLKTTNENNKINYPKEFEALQKYEDLKNAKSDLQDLLDKIDRLSKEQEAAPKKKSQKAFQGQKYKEDFQNEIDQLISQRSELEAALKLAQLRYDREKGESRSDIFTKIEDLGSYYQAMENVQRKTDALNHWNDLISGLEEPKQGLIAEVYKNKKNYLEAIQALKGPAAKDAAIANQELSRIEHELIEKGVLDPYSE